MRMYLAGEWVDRATKIDVVNPFNGDIVDTVPRAGIEDIDTAIASAERGATIMAAMSGYERYEMLMRAVALMKERVGDLGRTITKEEGKIISEGLGEAERAIQTMTASAEEAKRLAGEVVPLDGAPTWTGQLGFTLRVPCGIVAAISPFNFPLNLVAHKVGPALAAGSAGRSADNRRCVGRRAALLAGLVGDLFGCWHWRYCSRGGAVGTSGCG